MKLRTVRLLSGQAVRSLKKTPSVTSIIVVMACMIVLSSFMLVAVNLTHIGSQFQADVQIRAFLVPDLSPDVADRARAAIQGIPGVASVAFVGKDEALQRLGKQLGQDSFFLGDLPRNPLPESFDISLIRADVADEVAVATSEVDGIHDVRYAPKLVDRLVGVLRILWGITGAIAVLVLVGASLIVSNTIKLTVFARRKEIEIMKLVGATDSFILFPFVLEGIIIGFLGAGAAAAIVYAGYQGVVKWISSVAPFMPVVTDTSRLGVAVVVMLCFGAVVGLIGSNISTKRYLKV